MMRERVRHMVTRIIAATQPDSARFYHLCWWRDGVRCLHAYHTTEPHPIFLSLPGQVPASGLSPYQWKLVTGRILHFCQIMDMPMDLLPAQADRSRTGASSEPRHQMTPADRGRPRRLLTDGGTTRKEGSLL